MDGRMAMIISCRNLQTHENDVKFMVFTTVYGSNRSKKGGDIGQKSKEEEYQSVDRKYIGGLWF